MIRTIFAVIFVFLFLVLSIPYLLIEALLSKRDPKASSLRQLRVVQWAFRVVAFISGAQLKLTGMENIPADQPVLFVGNHLSLFDIVLSYGHLPFMTGFVAKKSIEKVPLLKTYMKRIGCLFLDRSDLRAGLKMILDACGYIKEGTSIFIFPEGTRNRSGDETALGEFHDGSFKIAQKTGCPVIPVAFHNTNALFEDHAPAIKKAPVTITFGKPVLFADLTPEERKHVGEHFRGIIIEMLKEIEPESER